MDYTSRADVNGAIAAYRRAIAIDHEYGEAWWGLAGIKSKVLTDGDIVLTETHDILAHLDTHYAKTSS
jgi:hypothetical protein